MSQFTADSRVPAASPQPAVSTFACANSECGAALGVDHVALVTTTHARRFCSVECVTEGHRAHVAQLQEEARMPSDEATLAALFSGPITSGTKAVSFRDEGGSTTGFPETVLAFRAMPGLAAYEVSPDGDLVVATHDGESVALPPGSWLHVMVLEPDSDGNGGSYTVERTAAFWDGMSGPASR